jgi:serine O-acetyltransferase
VTARPDRPLIRAVHQRHPPFKQAVFADLAVERRGRGEHGPLQSRAAILIELLRVIFVSDAFGALVLYRLKASCQRRGIPVIPRIAHRAAMLWSQVTIGDPVLVHPGVRLMHGHIVIDGFTEIHPGVQIRPFVTIGRRGPTLRGPTIGRGASIGTGAKILGPITIGARANIGANAVVISDVPEAAVVAGVPARRVK